MENSRKRSYRKRKKRFIINTFLPYPNFEQSAKCLDYKRLGKQRVEAWQIYQCLTGQGSLRWKNHPAIKMWNGYEVALLEYGMKICLEWIKRGYKDNMYLKFLAESYCKDFKIKYPSWLGDKNFHRAMQSNLLRKDKQYYSKFFKNIPDNLPYIWGEEK